MISWWMCFLVGSIRANAVTKHVLEGVRGGHPFCTVKNIQGRIVSVFPNREVWASVLLAEVSEGTASDSKQTINSK